MFKTLKAMLFGNHRRQHTAEKELLVLEKESLKQQYDKCFEALRYAEYDNEQFKAQIEHQNDRIEQATSVIANLCAMTGIDDETIYNAIAPFLDPDGECLFRAASTITKSTISDIESSYPYEAARGDFEFMGYRSLTRYLEIMAFGECETCFEGSYERTVKSNIIENDAWLDYRRQLYALVLTNIGIRKAV